MVFLWDRESGKELARIDLKKRISRANGLIFSPNGKFLALPGFAPEVVLWDLELGRSAEGFDGAGFKSAIGGMVFSPDGKTLAVYHSGAEGKDNHYYIRLWDIPEVKKK
jgi:WD40 repeat protein